MKNLFEKSTGQDIAAAVPAAAGTSMAQNGDSDGPHFSTRGSPDFSPHSDFERVLAVIDQICRNHTLCQSRRQEISTDRDLASTDSSSGRLRGLGRLYRALRKEEPASAGVLSLDPAQPEPIQTSPQLPKSALEIAFSDGRPVYSALNHLTRALSYIDGTFIAIRQGVAVKPVPGGTVKHSLDQAGRYLAQLSVTSGDSLDHGRVCLDELRLAIGFMDIVHENIWGSKSKAGDGKVLEEADRADRLEQGEARYRQALSHVLTGLKAISDTIQA